jgi:formylglycine-generating enzyme required for sulfatase activity
MMQTEVTVAAYKVCVAAGACPADELTQDTPQATCNAPHGRSTHPMNCVSHASAHAFCAWAGGRLPTAVEWEYAAKSGQSRVYPWGDGPVTGRQANFCDRNCPRALNEAQQKQWRDNGWVAMSEDDGWAATAPPGSFAAGDSAWQLKDMAGNVWEWTSSNYHSDKMELRGGGLERQSTQPPSRLSLWARAGRSLR